MAKAIKQIERIEITEEERRKQDLQEIENSLLKNKDALLDTLDLLKHMHARGVIPLLSGLFAEGDKVLQILIKKADTKETANTLKNLLLMVGVLGTINVKQLEPILLKLNAGIARVSESKDDDDTIGYFDIVRSLKDPEINRSIALFFEFLKGMGSATEHLERTTQLPEHQAHHANPDHRF
ncbi:DUF1641 domain-containing protein [Bacillus sp. ISL-18]|uniref:DUF1641 domain-containing protein n=1 Tax=Bacillus sp. ISL-18 TaxID=2819118 RepID=UPI001BECF998|nr:DUF1641 domain-containing protein [Bacillus sp. ISL-18]MBT2656084.1 DUF1641 domain-containing protein [Bacillus sp. ISL-18]